MSKKNNYYEEQWKEFVERTSGADMAELYRPFIEYISEGGHILDAGCGSGRDSKYFLSAGYKVTAFDNSAKMVENASEFTGLDVLSMSFDDVQWVNRFDGIWACASLLHVPKKRIGIILKKLLDALKVSGVIYMSFKYGSEETVDQETGRFFNNYTPDELKILLQQQDELEIIDVWESNSPLRQNKVLIWTNALARKISSDDRF